MLEWITMLTMLIDHLGFTFFTDLPILRAIGRIAFPLYCFFIVLGMERTRNRKRYFKRLFFIAIILKYRTTAFYPVHLFIIGIVFLLF
ncbi:MAG: conjugal transfer protein TraX [Firmicutes bacterium]|nr:conjugal transfer protein TraX [Bacillota bacterium]